MKIKIVTSLVSTIVFLIAVTLIIFIHNNAVDDKKSQVKEIALSKAYSLQKQIDLSVSSTLALASYIKEHDSIENFDSLATEIRRIHKTINVLEVIPNGKIAMISPMKGNEKTLGLDVFEDPERRNDAIKAKQTKSLVITGPLILKSGEKGIIARYPVFKNKNGKETFWGFAAAVVYVDSLLFESGIEKLKSSGYEFALLKHDSFTKENAVFISSGEYNYEPGDVVTAQLDIQNQMWLLAVRPKKGWSNQSFLIYGFLFSFLLSVLVFNLVIIILKQPQKLKEEVRAKTKEASELSSRLESLIRNMKGGILFEDVDRKVILINKSLLKMFELDLQPVSLQGGDCKEITGQLKHFFLHPQKFEDDISKAVENKIEIICDELQTKNEKYFERDYIPIYSGEIFIGHLWIYRDISERKKAEQEILNSLEYEKELNQLKSRFVSLTSHEFRTPLASILASAEMLENYRSKWDEAKIEKHLKRIQNSAGNMSNLLDGVLTLSKIEAAKLGFNPATLKLKKFFEDLVEEIRLSSSNKHEIKVTMDIRCEEAVMDEKLLQHIFSNLLSNAVKYTPEGKKIELKFYCNDEQKLIAEIIDEGIGIPQSEQQYLFDSFFRAENVGEINGTGLGLHIVKKSVDLHNGNISFTSKENEGTIFKVELPLFWRGKDEKNSDN